MNLQLSRKEDNQIEIELLLRDSELVIEIKLAYHYCK